MKINIRILLLALIFVTPNANAILIDNGSGLIYDSELDVTWLQDANYAMTSGLDADGNMSWVTASNWAADLSYAGYDDWRLPTYDNTNPRPTTSTSTNEIGSLWNELSGGDTLSADELLPFFNLVDNNAHWYWTSQVDVNDPTSAWRIDMECACWDSQDMGNEYAAWAVHDGNISSIPEPASLFLMGIGLAGLGLHKRIRLLK